MCGKVHELIYEIKNMLFVKKILEIFKKSEGCNKSELRWSNIVDEIVCMEKKT